MPPLPTDTGEAAVTIHPFHPGADVAITSTPQPVTARVRSLVEWRDEAQAAHALATGLVDTSFVPKQFRGKPIEGAAAILAGSEVGLSPLASLRSFDVIEGTASPRALTLRAIVQSLGHSLIVVESTEHRCVIRGRRRGEQEWQESVWTIQRAQRLKLTGKDNWQKQPQAMLLARATAECARMIAADALLGIPYTLEELADEVAVELEPRTRTVRRQQPAAVEAAPAPAAPAVAPPAARSDGYAGRPVEDTGLPPLPGEDATESAAGPGGDRAATAAQLKKMGAVFGALTVTDRAERLALTSRIVGRGITTASDLTRDEAKTLIDTLEGNGPQMVEAYRAEAFGDADPDGDEGLPDPTVEDAWGAPAGGDQA